MFAHPAMTTFFPNLMAHVLLVGLISTIQQLAAKVIFQLSL